MENLVQITNTAITANNTMKTSSQPINLIYARSLNEVIGNGLELPWRIPGDLARFKELTMNGVVVMGRKTWDSLPKKPLVGRINIILSNRPGDYEATGVHWAASVGRVMDLLRQYSDKPVWVIGGANIYKQFEALADTVYETVVMSSLVKGDTHYRFSGYSTEKISEEWTSCQINGQDADVIHRILKVNKRE